MSIDAAHTRWWQIGEVVFGIPLVLAIVLQRFAPLPFVTSNFGSMFLPIGLVFCILGIALVVATRRIFSRYSQPTDPGLSTSLIVHTGIFSVSRNPMYLGVVCLLVGLAWIFKLTWIFVFLLPTLVACHFILILPEERYLTIKFGAEYQKYIASVYRWFGRKPQP